MTIRIHAEPGSPGPIWARPITRRVFAVLLLILGIAPLLAGCAATDSSERVTIGGGVVAADHGWAQWAGEEMLRRGGNAVDAAVATSLALSVVRPDSCGIGGGGFMLIHLENHPEHGTADIALNYRETCPAGVGPDTYAQWDDDPTASRVGGRAVAVPGTVAGLLHALEKYGTLDRTTVFAPAIRLARKGWMADAHHVKTARSIGETFDRSPAYRDRFGFVEKMTAGGSVGRGQTLYNQEQAHALARIADLGADEFYQGTIAHAIVGTVRDDGGVLTLDDLANYRVQETRPIRVPLGDAFGGRTLLVMPPPSSGGIAIAQVFAMLDHLARDAGFVYPHAGDPEPRDARMLIEAMKHAFADRARFLADPAYAEVPVGPMLDPANLADAARRIAAGGIAPPESAGVYRPAFIDDASIPEDGGTSHISVVDAMGNAVACTETINLAFGSMLAVDWYGFCLNNEMDDFTTVRGRANAFGLTQSDDNLPEPGKRPLSSMSPTIVLDPDGSVYAVAGASGGPRIITATMQALLRVLLGDASAAQAVSAPRLHHQWQPDAVFVESWTDTWTRRRAESAGDAGRVGLRASLDEIGYAVRVREDIGACQLIRRVEPANGAAIRRYEAAADPRKRDRDPFVQ
jgi:gamma-glutamyltranspeptidase/glutathione hydrolase